MKISFELKQTTGMQFVLERMQPSTPYGEERIRNLYYYSSEEKDALEAELTNVGLVLASLEGHRAEYERIKLSMLRMKDIRRSLRNCQEHICLSHIELFEIKRFLLQLGEITPAFKSIAGLEALCGVNFSELKEALEIIDPVNPDRIGFFIADSRSPQLAEIRGEKKRLEMKIAQAADREEKEDLKYQRQAVCIREEEEEQTIREAITLELSRYAGQILGNIESVGRFDFILQKALLAAEFNGIKPVLTAEDLLLENMINPQVQTLLEANDCVFTPVSIELSKGAAVITGANMGGKSVALKTLALNTILCHAGFFVFARQARIPLLHSVQCIFESEQSLEKGLSGFAAEIINFKAALAEAERGFSLFLLDEFARSTNPDEGAMIVKGVARYLNKKNVLAVLSTHYDNVTQEGNTHYQVIGLKKMDKEKVRAQIAAEPGNSLAIIAKYMDYGLYKVYGREDCPRDALNICRLLKLDGEILASIEQTAE